MLLNLHYLPCNTAVSIMVYQHFDIIEWWMASREEWFHILYCKNAILNLHCSMATSVHSSSNWCAVNCNSYFWRWLKSFDLSCVEVINYMDCRWGGWRWVLAWDLYTIFIACLPPNLLLILYSADSREPSSLVTEARKSYSIEQHIRSV